MKIVVTGSSGLIGTALVASLVTDGHQVVRLVRRPPASPDEAHWDPARGTVDGGALAGAAAVVHLAGAGIGDRRWTQDRKREILRSRADGTATLSRALAGLAEPPRVLVSQSAVGYYGDTGGRPVDESAPKGSGFSADVVEAWEQAAEPARVAGIRVVHPRSGLVMTSHGGAWGRLLPLFRLGLGGHLGGGQQYWSWITLADEIRGLRFLVDSELSGPVNLTAPEPATNDEITVEMGRALHRPTAFAVPTFALRTVLGELSWEVLSSIRVLPNVLTAAGFQWSYPDLASAVDTLK